MKTLGSATSFRVSNIDASLKFYLGILGFTERFRFGDYAGVEHGDVQIHLVGPKVSSERIVGQGSIYIFCDDVDGYHADITAKGAAAPIPPKDYDYGMRDFVFRDPDGNLLTFGQECGK